MINSLVPVSHPGFRIGSQAELAEAGLQVAPGTHGTVLVGPYIPLDPGIYRVSPVFLEGTARPGQGAWDICESSHGYAARRFDELYELLVYLPLCSALEFRVNAEGDGFLLTGFKVEAVLLDTDQPPGHHLFTLAHQFLAERADVSAISRLASRLDAAGESTMSVWVRARAAERRFNDASRIAGELREIHAVSQGRLGVSAGPPMDLAMVQAVLLEQPLSLVDMTEPRWPIERARLEQHGYSWQALQSTRLHKSVAALHRPWQDEPHQSQMLNEMAELDFNFQVDLARGAGMSAYCPVSGRSVRSHHAFCIFEYGIPFTFHRFEGVEVFYVCSGGIYNSPVLIYLPQSQIALQIAPKFIVNFDYKYLVAVFNANLVHWRDQLSTYLASQPKPAAIVSHANLGHFFWNDLGGLQHAIDSGAAGELVELVRTGPDYFPVQEVFPELAGIKTSMLSNPWSIFGHCLKTGLLPIRFTDMRLSATTAGRVIAAAQRGSSDPRPQAANRPLILINLRVHNKMWVDHVEGYAQILNRLYAEFGSASAVIDGWRDCAEAFAAIRQQTRPEVVLYDGLSFGLHDTLNWSAQIDAYIAVVGSGLVLVNWLAGKPGVCHADLDHMVQLDWWSQVRPDAPPPLRPEREEINDLGGGAYANYKVDWRRLYDLLIKALAQGGVVPPSNAPQSRGKWKFGRA